MDKYGSQLSGSSKALTTYVQADSTCFQEVVQLLTGPSGNNAAAPKVVPTPKLHERRKHTRPKILIQKPGPQFHSVVQRSQLQPPMMTSLNSNQCQSPLATYWICQCSIYNIPTPSGLMLIPPSLHTTYSTKCELSLKMEKKRKP
ncbi:VQ motif-containing protein motif-containing protein [Forsythia ovata]|uniref:VQ motif-containing protein motif-containing protein n=1 Tax=Forsythia ovata TaxID=205694 RepID=A0ABD1U6J9_9LAMI